MNNDKLLRLYDAAPDKVKQGGSAWYWRARRASRKVGRAAGIPWHRAAAAIAVLSPQVPWEKNLEMAAELADAIGNDKPIPEPQTFGRNWSKAIAVLEGEPIEENVKGPKVTAFYHAICGDDTRAVVDSWMCRLLDYDKVPRPGRTYDRLAAEIHDAARALNLSVAEFQATLWIFVRDHGKRLSDGSVVVQEPLLEEQTELVA